MHLSFKQAAGVVALVLVLAAVLLVWRGRGRLTADSGDIDDPLAGVRDRLPQTVGAWRAEAPDREYDPDSIFSYIDGAGEVYRAFDMQRCLSRRYNRPGGPALVLDLFVMATPADALGVFTHDLDGEPAGIGEDSRYRPGWLCFWQGRLYASIYAEAEADGVREAVRQLGAATAALVPPAGTRPPILAALPAPGLDAGRIRYFHHPVILSAHYFLANVNLLRLGPGTAAVLADYRRGGSDAKLLVVEYATVTEAERAVTDFLAAYLPEGQAGAATRLENDRWAGAQRADRRLAVVLEASDADTTEALLRESLSGGGQ
ncbi:MAG: hypothetical protein GX414_12925 [Acidobacteria bacterium]|nr:hypothetical protein [Acidobacteriota bacterium]